MKRRWIIAAFLVVFMLGNVCGYAVQSNSKMDESVLGQTESTTVLPTATVKPEKEPSSAPMFTSTPLPMPTATSVLTDEQMAMPLSDEIKVDEGQTDMMDGPLKISIRINSGDRELVPNVKKSVRFGGVVKIEGSLENGNSDLRLYIGVSPDDKENVQLLDTTYVELGEGEQEFEVGKFSLEPYMEGTKLPESVALFVGMGENIEYVMNLPIDANHTVVICGLICGGCIIAMTLCIVLLIRTNRKLRKEKYRLLDMQTRKSQRTVRNEK